MHHAPTASRHTAEPELPAQPLLALATCWNLGVGEHPALAAPLAGILGAMNPFPAPEEWQGLAPLGLPLTMCTHGHHVWKDTATRHAAVPWQADEFPLAPLFVRDLAGRVVHTGLLPLPSVGAQPVFPAGCSDVPASLVGAAYIENAVFTTFQLLEIAPSQGPEIAGLGRPLQVAYAHPSRYPYKIRPLTFYADGWRLPQVARLFARAVAPESVAARDAAAKGLVARWESRPAGQEYEAFYESNQGAAWFEELFLQGVTVIPTFEGYNGVYDVADDFSVRGVEAGRAVAGLHAVVGRVASAKPAGTILEVKAPGYVTSHHIHPAEVVVSNGPSWVPEDAWVPNLALPHPHVSPVWGACWLPTKPAHFAEPALWDWSPTGVFMQVAGPLWCPQHYVYASTATLVRQARKPLPENPHLLVLPEKLKARFHPAVGLMAYDTLNERTRQERMQHSAHPLYASALDVVPLGREITPVGYHALPPGWPSVGQASYLPNTGSTGGAAVGACPAGVSARLAPQVAPLGAAEGAPLAAYHVAVSEPMRSLVEAAGSHTGVGPEWPEGDVHLTAAMVSEVPEWLPEIPASELMLNVKRLFASRAVRQALAGVHPGLPEALFRFKEAALGWRRLRYRLFAKYPALWVMAHSPGHSLATVEVRQNMVSEAEHGAVRRAMMAMPQVGSVGAEATEVPLHAAVPLRKRAGSGRVKQQQA